MIELAFTTRIPLAVLIVLGIKRHENRKAMPDPPRGRCAVSCSRSSDAREYAAFLRWARPVLPQEAYRCLPPWETVAGWRGKLIAVCDYEAGYAPGPPAWDEGYRVWWRLTRVRPVPEPIPCRGSLGMWPLPQDIARLLPDGDAPPLPPPR